MIRSTAFLCTLLIAQSPQAQEVEESRVREILSFLASDELAGRDSPSPGLEKAASYLAENFDKAGLQPAGDSGGYFYSYSLPGVLLDESKVELTLIIDGQEQELDPGGDFRLWSSSRPFEAEGVEFERVFTRQRRASRKPTLLVTSPDSQLWQSAGTREVLSRGAPGAAPTFLVREGILPAEGEVLANISVPEPEKVDVQLKNVIAMIPGTDLKDEFVVIGAHYDHVGVRPSNGADQIFNGADDDATGTTAVLALAEAFAKSEQSQRRSLLFMCFSAEEKGLRGSRAYVEKPTVPIEDIVAVVNIEMLGRPEPGKEMQAWVTGREFSDFEAICKPALATVGVDTVVFPMEARLFNASDNAPFFAAGVVAHSISAGSLHADYHQPGDEVAKISFAHMTTVINGIGLAISEFANREERPALNEAGKAALEERKSRRARGRGRRR
ncbi:MAG: M28 family metallopeptidase [Planctomycetota bacterium]|jgi:hypothetical protein